MENKEIRLRNTRALIQQSGGVALFAEKLKKAETQVSAFAGSNPRKGIGNKIAREIEEAFGKAPGWLDVLQYPLSKSNVGDAFAVEQNAAHYEGKRTKVPLISWVQAGNWCESPDNFSPGDAEDWIDCSFPHSSSTYCLRVVGQSMFPDYREGEIIFVDPEIVEEHGDDVVVRTLDNKHTFKRLQITPDGKYLLAVNPDHPERIMRIPDETRICGVVIASQQSRRIKSR